MNNPLSCTHGLDFSDWDDEAALHLGAHEVRARWPRFSGTCKACGFTGTWYYSLGHYVAGDW